VVPHYVVSSDKADMGKIGWLLFTNPEVLMVHFLFLHGIEHVLLEIHFLKCNHHRNLALDFCMTTESLSESLSWYDMNTVRVLEFTLINDCDHSIFPLFAYPNCIKIS
jgi:hypothetical protein